MAAIAKRAVLVIDDDENVRMLARWILERLGCRVAVAGSADSGIAQYREALERRERFDAVVTDLTLPGAAGGSEILASLRAIDPEVVAFVMSGDDDDPRMRDWAAHGFAGAIAKSRLHETIPLALRDRLGMAAGGDPAP